MSIHADAHKNTPCEKKGDIDFAINPHEADANHAWGGYGRQEGEGGAEFFNYESDESA